MQNPVALMSRIRIDSIPAYFLPFIILFSYFGFEIVSLLLIYT